SGEEVVWEGSIDHHLTSITPWVGRERMSTRPLLEPPANLALVSADRIARMRGASPARLIAVADPSAAPACSSRPRRAVGGPISAGARLALSESRRCDRPALPVFVTSASTVA